MHLCDSSLCGMTPWNQQVLSFKTDRGLWRSSCWTPCHYQMSPSSLTDHTHLHEPSWLSMMQSCTVFTHKPDCNSLSPLRRRPSTEWYLHPLPLLPAHSRCSPLWYARFHTPPHPSRARRDAQMKACYHQTPPSEAWLDEKTEQREKVCPGARYTCSLRKLASGSDLQSRATDRQPATEQRTNESVKLFEQAQPVHFNNDVGMIYQEQHKLAGWTQVGPGERMSHLLLLKSDKHNKLMFYSVSFQEKQQFRKMFWFKSKTKGNWTRSVRVLRLSPGLFHFHLTNLNSDSWLMGWLGSQISTSIIEATHFMLLCKS